MAKVHDASHSLPQVNGDGGSGGGSGGAGSASPLSPAASPPPSTALGENEMATMTDPDTLGPCEPGTAVKLEGIVHHVTDRGEREICGLTCFTPK